jgi:uncharacterized protein
VTTASQATTTGPTAVTSRALGPDLARGLMLAFIALANSHYFLVAPAVLGGFPQDGSTLDRVVIWLIATFVDGRSFPLFGLLFGYGVAQVVRRQTGTRRETRHLLWRRSLVLIAIGLLDALLFYVGDIVAMYGVLLLVGAWLVHRRDRWLLLIALGFFVLSSLPDAGSLATSAEPPGPAMLPGDPLSQLADRAPVALSVALGGPIGFAAPFLLGLVAGRRRVLERVDQHRRLLTGTAVVGISLAVLGAQPVALVLAGAAEPPSTAVLGNLGSLHAASGVLGGCGYAALIVLVAARLSADRNPAVRAVAAAGQRSLTCYLIQSVAWAVLFTPYLLDLADDLSIAATALFALAVWLLSVVAADRMRRAGHRGPFELLVRRVTYRAPRGG